MDNNLGPHALSKTLTQLKCLYADGNWLRHDKKINWLYSKDFLGQQQVLHLTTSVPMQLFQRTGSREGQSITYQEK